MSKPHSRHTRFVAAAVTLIALCLSLSTHLFVTLLASLVSFFAALLLLIAFAIQIALFARLKKLVGDLDIEGANTKPGIGMSNFGFDQE